MNFPYDDSIVPRTLDPLDGTPNDFAWDEVFERLGEIDGTVADSPERHETLSRLMNLLLADAQGHKISPKAIGLRFVALAWVLNPANFPDNPSLRQLAKRCEVSPAALAHFTGTISRLTGIRNRAQRHAGNWRPAERSVQ